MRNDFFSARDAARNFGALLEAADAGPVTIRRHGRPRAAVISWRLFEDYSKAYEDAIFNRRVQLLEAQLQAVIDGRLGTSDRIRALSRRLAEGEASLADVAPGEKAPPR